VQGSEQRIANFGATMQTSDYVTANYGNISETQLQHCSFIFLFFHRMFTAEPFHLPLMATNLLPGCAAALPAAHPSSLARPSRRRIERAGQFSRTAANIDVEQRRHFRWPSTATYDGYHRRSPAAATAVAPHRCNLCRRAAHDAVRRPIVSHVLHPGYTK
jgi:hypothetical protein